MATLTVQEAEIALGKFMGCNVTIITEEEKYDDHYISEGFQSAVEWEWNLSVHKVTSLPLPCIDSCRRIEVMFSDGTTASGFAADWSKEWNHMYDRHITKWRYNE